jgi:hypothetical protein
MRACLLSSRVRETRPKEQRLYMHTLKAALSRRTAKQVLPLVARARRTRKLSDVYGAEYCVYAIMRMHAASINEEMAQKMHVHA